LKNLDNSLSWRVFSKSNILYEGDIIMLNENIDYDVFLTGGTGFIGSKIANWLSKEGLKVICFDINGENYRVKSDNERIFVVKGDILDSESVDYWISRSLRVFHLGAIVGVDEYVTRPQEVLDVNILGSRNVMMSCLKHKRPLLIASTSEVYGKNKDLLSEDSDRLYGSSSYDRWSYAVSKSAAEHYAYALGKQGLDFVIVRYFNIYGPTMDIPGKGRVISKFLGAIQDGKPLTLVNGGNSIRTFCYIDDAIEATVKLGLGIGSDVSYRNSAINIGRDDPYTIRQLANIIIELTGHKHGTVDACGKSFFGDGFEDISHRVPNVSRLYRAIGFKARTTLKEGLRRTLEYWNLLNEDNNMQKHDTEFRQIIPMTRPYFDIDDFLLLRYKEILNSGNVTNNGKYLRHFEAMLSEFLRVPDVVVVSNGADALLMAVKASGLNKGKAILPSYTYIATLNALILNGLEPIFCDIDPETFTMDPGVLQKILERESNIKCILPVNVFGVPPAIDEIVKMAKLNSQLVIYDNSHGFGTETGGKRVLSGPDVTIFSLHGTKIMPAIEGGLVTSSDLGLLMEIRRLRNHGLITDNLLDSSAGFNSKMDEIRAATGIHVLSCFEEVVQRRRSYGKRLSNFLSNSCSNKYQLQKIPVGVNTNYQNLGVICRFAYNKIDVISKAFREFGVEARSYFNPPLHRLKIYKGSVTLKETDRVWSSLLCLPMHSRMSENDLSRIEEAALNVAQRN